MEQLVLVSYLHSKTIKTRVGRREGGREPSLKKLQPEDQDQGDISETGDQVKFEVTGRMMRAIIWG